MASPSIRRRRPLLYLLIAGFVAGVAWLTRAAWRPARGRAGAGLRDLRVPAVAPAASPRPGDGTARPSPRPVAPAVGVTPVPDRVSVPLPGSQPDVTPSPVGTVPTLPAHSGGTVAAPTGIAGGAPAPGSSPLDDLTRLEGVGRRMAAALVDEGISTFDALALASPVQLRAALANQGLRFAPSLTTWPEQARLLAQGDEPGFAAMSARLRRGGPST